MNRNKPNIGLTHQECFEKLLKWFKNFPKMSWNILFGLNFSKKSYNVEMG